MEELVAQEKEMTGSEVEEEGHDCPLCVVFEISGCPAFGSQGVGSLMVREQPGNTVWKVADGHAESWLFSIQKPLLGAAEPGWRRCGAPVWGSRLMIYSEPSLST